MIVGVKRDEKEGYKHKWGACWVNRDKEKERKDRTGIDFMPQQITTK